MIDPADIDLKKFLARWYGPPSPMRQLSTEALWLPAPLKEWYQLASCWSILWSGGNRMVKPSRIRVDRGKAVFMEDSTGDWAWAFDAEETSLVYEGDPGRKWYPVAEAFPEFLKHATVLDATVLADFGRLYDQVPEEVLPQILVSTEEVGFGGWRWPRPGKRVFMSDSLVANVGPAVDPQTPWRNRSGYAAVRIVGLEAASFDHLELDPSLKWIDLRPNEVGDDVF